MAAPSGNRLALVLFGIAALVGLVAWLLLRDAPEVAAVAIAPVLRLPPQAARKLAAPAPRPIPVVPAPRRDAGSPFGPFALLSPVATVSTQVRLLEEGDDAAFRDTFLPEVRAKVTPDAIAACRKRLAQARVQPDWEMAEDSTEGGHKVQRVSMWGKSVTGFHEEGGAWLADQVWCVPTGVP